MMQTYKTVKEVIDFLETYHRRLKDFHQKQRDTVNSERLQMLLDYIGRHRKNIQDVLENISQKDQDIILKTWIQFVPFSETILSEEQLTDSRQDIDGVVHQALEIEDSLIRFYNKMIHQNGIPEPVKEFFQHLIKIEAQEKAQVAETAQQIKDL